MPKVFESEEDKATDEWWRDFFLINGFNESCNDIASSALKIGDELTSAISFMKTTKGNLAHLSYILRKLDPPGTEFKTLACSITGALLLIEFQKVK